MQNNFRKSYSKEELKKIEKDYRTGLLIPDIAQKYGRTPYGIEKLVGVYGWLRDEPKSGRYSNGRSFKKEEEDLEKKKLMEFQQFSRTLIGELKSQKFKIQAPSKEKLFKGKLEEDAALILSDIHCGKVNYFSDFTSGKAIQTYNQEIMIQEANRLLESITEINQLLSGGYNLRKLYVFCVGDLIDNDIIIKGQQFFVDIGAGAQVVAGTELLSGIFRELLKTFQQIEVIIVGGNHGRFTQRIELAPFYNNFDWLVGQMLKYAFQSEPRIKITTPESWFHIVEIRNWKYSLHHGNTVYSWLGFPYYGITRAGKSRRAEFPVDMEIIGHFHQKLEIPVSSKSITLLNGSWVKNDEYSWKKYGQLTKPEQWYFGISDKRPRSWCFALDLDPKFPHSLLRAK